MTTKKVKRRKPSAVTPKPRLKESPGSFQEIITPAGFYTPDLLGAGYTKFSPADLEIKSLLSSTGTVLGGTIGSLETFDKALGVFEHDAMSKLSSGLEKKIIDGLMPFKVELDTVRTQVVEAKKTVSVLKVFMEDNATFLTDLISAKGRMNGVESQLISILSRLDKIETNKTVNWNRALTITSIIIALISAGVAFYVAVYR